MAQEKTHEVVDMFVNEYGGEKNDHRLLTFVVQPPLRPSQIGYVQVEIGRRVVEVGPDLIDSLPAREQSIFKDMLDDFDSRINPSHIAEFRDATEIAFKFYKLSRYSLSTAEGAQGIFRTFVEQAIQLNQEQPVRGNS